MTWYKRGEPLFFDCPVAFHYDDFVELNDGSVAGFVRGGLSTSSIGNNWLYNIILDEGDVVTFMGRMLRLVFRVEDPVARAEAHAAYRKNKL